MLIQDGERRRFAMGRRAIGLRDDFDGNALRRLARRSRDAGQARRLLALAEIYDGGSRGDAGRIGGVTLQSIRDWVVRFNEGGPDGLIDLKAPGPETKLNDDHRARLRAIVEAGPIPAIHGVVRWRLIDLAQGLSDEFGVSLDETTVGRELRALGFRKLSARPRHHAQNELAVEAFKKTSPPNWRRSKSSSVPA
jgi:transposase